MDGTESTEPRAGQGQIVGGCQSLKESGGERKLGEAIQGDLIEVGNERSTE
jgi:hypothetical protein